MLARGSSERLSVLMRLPSMGREIGYVDVEARIIGTVPVDVGGPCLVLSKVK